MNRIAIVEDDQGYRDTLFTYIKQYEQERDTAFEATPFEKADDFLAVYNGDYDIILMDIMMPKMNGLQAAKAIRAMQAERPDAEEIPIIALSANAFAEDVQTSLDAGMNGHISKPLNVAEVAKAIARNLNKS